MKSAKLLTALAAVVGVSALFAGCFSKPITIEILHVNDLHSNFDYGRTPDKGGYAAVKTALETMKNAAVARGHQVLTLNGGDSFEGHPYYFLNKGAESMKMVSLLPFDATVVGNHDFLMGPADFDRLIGQSPAGFTWLASNISFDRSKYPNLARVLKRYVTFNKGGLRIAVIGLTTDSPFYRWALGDVVIRNPLIAAQELVAELRLQNDVIIALSHLGTSDDISLVEHTIGIDLVVGSHDHTPLYQPLIKKNPIGKHIPILQSEPFGEGVGHLTITVKKDRSYSIDGYEIAPVRGNVTGNRDANLVALAKAAAGKLDAQFGAAWLAEQLAESDIALENDGTKNTAWSSISADALREAAGTDIAIDFGIFHGMTLPAGPVTHYGLLRLYPRMFEFKPSGWSVWTMELPGALLPKAFELVLNTEFNYALSGGSFDVATDSTGHKTVSNLKVNGQPVDPVRVYTMAVPEGIARGLIEVPKLYEGQASPVLNEISADLNKKVMGFLNSELRDFNRTLRDTREPIWTALEAKMRSLGTIPASH